MGTLPSDSLACASDKKQDICNQCMRNLEQYDITVITDFGNFAPKKKYINGKLTYH